jgi:hypothetical protein
VFGFLARDSERQAIVRAERLTTELIKTVAGLFAPFALDEENKARRARAVDQRVRSAQTIVKHYHARNADRADAGIDRLELQVC